jgi:putative membrane protein
MTSTTDTLIALLHPILAWHGNGWHHGGWWILWLVVWALIVAVGLTLLWRTRQRPHDGASAKTILAERFARGEITETEYRERLETLKRIEGSG